MAKDELVKKDFEKAGSSFYHYLTNVIGGGFCLYYAWLSFSSWQQTGNWMHLTLFLRNGTLMVLFLIRLPPRLTSKRFVEWAAAFGGTFSGYFFVVKNTSPLSQGLVPVVYGLMVGVAVISIIAIFNLGRCFSIVPANRGVKTSCLYSIVRHPIYTCYTIFDIGLCLYCFSLGNCFVMVVSALLRYVRARYEEKLLLQDRAYQLYVQQTPYMFVPYVI